MSLLYGFLSLCGRFESDISATRFPASGTRLKTHKTAANFIAKSRPRGYTVKAAERKRFPAIPQLIQKRNSMFNLRNKELFTYNDRRAFYRDLVKLVIPITLQNLLSSLVNSADVLMLGYVGQDELAAVSLANQYMFILWGFFFGISSGATIMNSQYWGKGDMDAVQAILGIAFKLCLVLTGIVSALCVCVPRALMTLYTNDAALQSIGADYLRTIGISYLLMSFSEAYTYTLRSVGFAAKSTVISVITVGLNVLLNATFIFGLFGAPKLGVIGVAVATVIARAVELVICVFDYALKGTMFKADLKLLMGNHPVLFKDFVKYAGPALANDLIWTLAFSCYSIILGHLNNDIVAASSVSSTLRDLFTTVCYGLSSGGTVLLGKELGRNEMEKAKWVADLLCITTFIGTAVLGVILVLVRHPLMGFFTTLNETAYRYLNVMMIINGYYIIGQAMNTLLIAGIFRAGGNTKFGLKCDTITMWCVSLPLGFLSAFVFKLPPMVVYFILCLDEFWKVPVVIRYYNSDKWLNNITREKAV